MARAGELDVSDRVVVAALLAILAVDASAVRGAAAQVVSTKEDEGRGIRFPTTAEDHLAEAADYVKKAAAYREEAAMHRRMFAAYERWAADLAPKARRGKPKKPRWLDDLRRHCDSYAAGAERLAGDAEKLAEFHRQRASELHQP